MIFLINFIKVKKQKIPFSSWFSQEAPELKTISVPKPLVLDNDEELELAH